MKQIYWIDHFINGSVYSYAWIRLLLVSFCGWAVKMFDLLIYNVFVQLCRNVRLDLSVCGWAGSMLKNTTITSLLCVSGCNDVDKHECTTQANKQWPMEFLRSLFSVTCLASLCRPLPWQQEETTDGWSTTGHLNLGPIALAYQMNCFPLPQLKLKRQMNCCTN